METVRSVLFVDFDNIFSGLMNLDRDAGLAFARSPGRWLDRLRQHGLPADDQRRFLQARAYLNPAGWVDDDELGNESGRLYLQKFRPNLTRAGFEVIDCPALTQRQKNAADIRIVIDVLESLHSDAPFDEFVIASSDADFTPLLQVLRSRDRRMMVLSSGEASPAYHSVADSFVGPEALIALMVEKRTTVQSDPAAPADDGRTRAAQMIVQRVAESATPVLLSHLGNEIRAVLEHEITSTDWFGQGGLSAFIRTIGDGGGLATDPHHVWDPDQHEAPADTTTKGSANDLPPLIQDIRAATELPPLGSRAWAALFDALADYAASEPFNLTTCTAAVRDTLKETDTPVGRAVVGFVVRGAHFGGVRLDRVPPPDAAEIRAAFRDSVIERYEASGPPLEDEERDELDLWLSDR